MSTPFRQPPRQSPVLWPCRESPPPAQHPQALCCFLSGELFRCGEPVAAGQDRWMPSPVPQSTSILQPSEFTLTSLFRFSTWSGETLDIDRFCSFFVAAVFRSSSPMRSTGARDTEVRTISQHLSALLHSVILRAVWGLVIIRCTSWDSSAITSCSFWVRSCSLQIWSRSIR